VGTILLHSASILWFLFYRTSYTVVRSQRQRKETDQCCFRARFIRLLRHPRVRSSPVDSQHCCVRSVWIGPHNLCWLLLVRSSTHWPTSQPKATTSKDRSYQCNTQSHFQWKVTTNYV